MPPPTWVLLNREVSFEHDAEVSGGGGGGIERQIPSARGVLPPSPQDVEEAILSYLRTLEPDLRFADPPQLSTLHIRRPTDSIPWLCRGINYAFIANADKNLVALYAGPYRPGSNLEGGYLIYDIIKNSLSTIPQPPKEKHARDWVGLGTVVVCLEEDAYVLVELTKVIGPGPAQAALYTWQLSTKEWDLKIVGFPPELLCPPYHDFLDFEADMCFSYRASVLCWVDLSRGILFCDLQPLLQPAAQLEFRFVPLPKECLAICDPADLSSGEEPLDAYWSRSVACVGGSIKLVTMDGYFEQPTNEQWLTIWTLSPDLRIWTIGTKYLLSNIWKSESHLSLGLPEILPSFPVLSMDEDDVVYLVFSNVTMSVDGQLEDKGQYLLRVDMKDNKVSHQQHFTRQICSQLFACDCRAYLQGLKDKQGKVNEGKEGNSRKRRLL